MWHEIHTSYTNLCTKICKNWLLTLTYTHSCLVSSDTQTDIRTDKKIIADSYSQRSKTWRKKFQLDRKKVQVDTIAIYVRGRASGHIKNIATTTRPLSPTHHFSRRHPLHGSLTQLQVPGHTCLFSQPFQPVFLLAITFCTTLSTKKNYIF